MNYLKSHLDDPTVLNKFNENNINCKILYNHFALNHNIESDLTFQIFATNLITFRKRLETDLMLLFNSIYPNGLNSSTSFVLNTIDNYDIKI